MSSSDCWIHPQEWVCTIPGLSRIGLVVGPTLISLPCHKGMRKGLHVNRQFIY